MKKSLKLAAAAVLAALSLCTLKPVRTWASQEGAYIYHAFYINGPIVAYKAATAYRGSDGVSWFGISVTSGASTDTGVIPVSFIGAYTTTAEQALTPGTTNTIVLWNSTVSAPCRSSGTTAGAWVYFSTNATASLVACGS